MFNVLNSSDSFPILWRILRRLWESVKNCQSGEVFQVCFFSQEKRFLMAETSWEVVDTYINLVSQKPLFHKYHKQQQLLIWKSLVTSVTALSRVWSFGFQMNPQTACPWGGIITLVAFVWLFPTVVILWLVAGVWPTGRRIRRPKRGGRFPTKLPDRRVGSTCTTRIGWGATTDVQRCNLHQATSFRGKQGWVFCFSTE